MARLYTASFAATAVSVAVDLFELTPADDKPIEVYGIFLGQSSDPGDVQAEQLPFTVIRGHTTTGSGGSAATNGVALDRSNSVTSGFTFESCNTTAATAGTTARLFADVWNLQAGYQLWLPEESEWEASQADTTLVIRLGAAPADAVTVSATLFIRELG